MINSHIVSTGANAADLFDIYTAVPHRIGVTIAPANILKGHEIDTSLKGEAKQITKLHNIRSMLMDHVYRINGKHYYQQGHFWLERHKSPHKFGAWHLHGYFYVHNVQNVEKVTEALSGQLNHIFGEKGFPHDMLCKFEPVADKGWCKYCMKENLPLEPSRIEYLEKLRWGEVKPRSGP